MTKYHDWANVREMDSRQKSDINTETTFAEQREDEEKSVPKEFGIKEMSEYVPIEWENTELDPKPEKNKDEDKHQ